MGSAHRLSDTGTGLTPTTQFAPFQAASSSTPSAAFAFGSRVSHLDVAANAGKSPINAHPLLPKEQTLEADFAQKSMAVPRVGGSRSYRPWDTAMADGQDEVANGVVMAPSSSGSESKAIEIKVEPSRKRKRKTHSCESYWRLTSPSDY